MCQFLSAIVTQAGKRVHVNPVLDHHSDLLEWMASEGRGDFTRDDKPAGQQRFARVEFTPQNRAYHEPDDYKLRLDEHAEPHWWNAALAEDVAGQLRDVLGGIIVNGPKSMLVGPALIIGPSGRIKKVCHSRIIVLSGHVDVLGSSQIGTMWGSSQVGEMRDSSQVGKMRDSSQVGTIWGSSQVGEMWGSSQVGKMLNLSQVGEMWGSSQVGTMWGSSQVGEMWDSSQAPCEPKTDRRQNKQTV